MTNCIFYTLFFTLFLNLSMGSLRYSQINRVFTSIYKGMLEASIVTIGTNGEPTIPYYNTLAVGNYISKYMNENVSRYSKNYTVKTKYTKKDTGGYCLNNCDKLEITLNAEINIFYKYSKTQTFVISNESEL